MCHSELQKQKAYSLLRAALAYCTGNTHLEGYQGVAVGVCAEHVLFDPRLGPQRSGGAWELGRSDDVTREGLLVRREVTDRAGHSHATPSAVVPAPGHPPRAPAVPLVTAPRRGLHHRLQRC